MKIQNYLPKFLLSLPDLKYLNGDLIIIRKVKVHTLHNHFFPNFEAIGHINIRFPTYPSPLNLSKTIQANEIREIIRK
jgi:hypothetical protein